MRPSGPGGRVYVVDYYNQRVQVLDKQGAHVRTIGVTGEAGSGNHQFHFPAGVFVEPGPDGLVYVADQNNHRVQVLNKQGAYVRTIGVTGLQELQALRQFDHFSSARGVCVGPGPDGRVYAVDRGNERVLVFLKVPEAGEGPL